MVHQPMIVFLNEHFVELQQLRMLVSQLLKLGCLAAWTAIADVGLQGVAAVQQSLQYMADNDPAAWVVSMQIVHTLRAEIFSK